MAEKKHLQQSVPEALFTDPTPITAGAPKDLTGGLGNAGYEGEMTSANGVSVPKRHALMERLNHEYAYLPALPDRDFDGRHELDMNEKQAAYLREIGCKASAIKDDASHFQMTSFEPIPGFENSACASPIVAHRGTDGDPRDPDSDWRNNYSLDGLSENKITDNNDAIQAEYNRLYTAYQEQLIVGGHSQGCTTAMGSVSNQKQGSDLVKEIVCNQGAGINEDRADNIDKRIADGELSMTNYAHVTDKVDTLGYHPKQGSYYEVNPEPGKKLGIGDSHKHKEVLGKHDGAGQVSGFENSEVTKLEESRSEGMHSEELIRERAKYSKVGQAAKMFDGARDAADAVASGDDKAIGRSVDRSLRGSNGLFPQALNVIIAAGFGDAGVTVDDKALNKQRGGLITTGVGIGDDLADVTGERNTKVGRAGRSEDEKKLLRNHVSDRGGDGEAGFKPMQAEEVAAKEKIREKAKSRDIVGMNDGSVVTETPQDMEHRRLTGGAKTPLESLMAAITGESETVASALVDMTPKIMPKPMLPAVFEQVPKQTKPSVTD
jgi:hypothetical protein